MPFEDPLQHDVENDDDDDDDVYCNIYLDGVCWDGPFRSTHHSFRKESKVCKRFELIQSLDFDRLTVSSRLG